MQNLASRREATNPTRNEVRHKDFGTEEYNTSLLQTEETTHTKQEKHEDFCIEEFNTGYLQTEETTHTNQLQTERTTRTKHDQQAKIEDSCAEEFDTNQLKREKENDALTVHEGHARHVQEARGVAQEERGGDQEERGEDRGDQEDLREGHRLSVAGILQDGLAHEWTKRYTYARSCRPEGRPRNGRLSEVPEPRCLEWRFCRTECSFLKRSSHYHGLRRHGLSASKIGAAAGLDAPGPSQRLRARRRVSAGAPIAARGRLEVQSIPGISLLDTVRYDVIRILILVLILLTPSPAPYPILIIIITGIIRIL